MIHLATRIAYESKFRRARVGCVIVHGSRIISSGCNRIGYTHFLRDRDFPESIHAEQAAILRLLRRNPHSLVGSTIYVSRVDRMGNAKLAKPCLTCQRIIKAVGIRRVIFTTNTGVEQL